MGFKHEIEITVLLDGKKVEFEYVDHTPPECITSYEHSSGRILESTTKIKLVLASGEVIHDDGSRVEIIRYIGE